MAFFRTWKRDLVGYLGVGEALGRYPGLCLDDLWQ